MTLRQLFPLAAATLAFSQIISGIDPRPSMADYPARAANDAVSIGAVFLSGSDQHKILERDWSGTYLMVEVALYPEPGHRLTVAPRDFMLRVGDQRVAPVDSDAIVPYPQIDHGPISPNSKVHVVTVDSIGVTSGPNGHKTVYTDSQVGVEAGNRPYPSPVPQPQDPKFELRRPLEQKELPDAKSLKPIAGYLYFPKPKKSGKNPTYELAYYGESGKLNLTLPKKH